MNEKIKQLAKEAGFITNPNTDVIKNNHFGGYMDGQQFEKFAELIVQECMSYMEDGDIDFAKFMIKKHFGVEE